MDSLIVHRAVERPPHWLLPLLVLRLWLSFPRGNLLLPLLVLSKPTHKAERRLARIWRQPESKDPDAFHLTATFDPFFLQGFTLAAPSPLSGPRITQTGHPHPPNVLSSGRKWNGAHLQKGRFYMGQERKQDSCQEKRTAMHDLILASVFVAMLLAPCIVSLRSGEPEENS
jgi:hypothetical protein